MSDEALIETIVSHVMEHLRAGEAAARRDERAVASSNNGHSKAEESAVVVSDAVITAELLEKQARGAKRLHIGVRSILTPSAHDFLRTHKLHWTRQSVDTKNSPAPAARWRVVVVAATPAVDAAIREANQAHWMRQLSGSWREAADGAVGAICRAEIDGAVVVCRETAATACRANRNVRIRAAAATTLADVREIGRTMGANLYCIDPADKSSFELRNILREIAAASPRVAADWKE